MSSTEAVRHWLPRILRASLPASMATTAAVAVCGQAENHNAVAPINAISHILWGDEAAKQEDFSLEHTVAGIALNTAAVASWAAVYELTFGNAARKGSIPAAVVGGAVVAALAYVTDYHVVPERLTPGFEKRLSGASLLAVYATLAVSLPLMSIIEGRAEEKLERTRRRSVR